MRHRNWQCPKCGEREFDVDQFRAVGGLLAKLLDIQNKRFLTVTCGQCTYTEVYRTTSSTLGSAFDLITG